MGVACIGVAYSWGGVTFQESREVVDGALVRDREQLQRLQGATNQEPSPNPVEMGGCLVTLELSLFGLVSLLWNRPVHLNLVVVNNRV